MIRNDRWYKRDNTVAQNVNRNINPASETVGIEQDTARRAFELVEQFRAREAANLYQQIQIVFRTKIFHPRRQLLHRSIIREQNKGVAVGLPDEMFDPMC